MIIKKNVFELPEYFQNCKNKKGNPNSWLVHKERVKLTSRAIQIKNNHNVIYVNMKNIEKLLYLLWYECLFPFKIFMLKS